MRDEYFTIDHPSEGLYKEKGSKFLAYLLPVKDEEEIAKQLLSVKKKHPKSRHVCYAYRLGPASELYRFNDDGEPSGSAGRPIYNELLSAKLTDVLLAVVRYFGGTKLGVSGLIKAYKISSRDSINENIIVKKYITKFYTIKFDIQDIGNVYNSLKQTQLEISQQMTGIEPAIRINVRASKAIEEIHKFLAHFHGISVDHVLHESFSSKISIK